ncbi:TPA: hypothetical protein TVN94_000027 [Streptococcus equi subsp. zooepidemicus]|uniref:hypothetical protein n=1 Tax=Streptococcus TaxID=1301 RepID=UPI00034D15BF|nr:MULTISPECIES: hypothetical protein [Streptococcus]MCD3406908.1 hypothetical protein [Streptococcus equi subsp. zooepidemicus]MCW1011999.1 hypothetical protein [Streptococcus anginosus]MDI5946352.1 hypothetical protein [Streptococcus equi subsp. zooepidemicus]MDI5957391.1 hypothetical protein [Streptococcus equi subsp. zooepidemicus]MDI6087980.1 hypothetical protein [Streptococcus equi subsp. zooepidemicus]
MLEKEVLELVVKKVMDKFARENDGLKGWTKEDIQNEILNLGGTMTDVYEAMKIGLDICLLEEKVEPVFS